MRLSFLNITRSFTIHNHYRYSAHVHLNEKLLLTLADGEANKLIARASALLEDSLSDAYCKIIDEETDETIQTLTYTHS